MPHIHTQPGHVDFTAEVFIVHQDKVLLRQHDKYKIWLSVGGHIELHENPNEAAIREVAEEVGLTVQLYDSRKHCLCSQQGHIELIPPQFLNIHQISPEHRHCSFVYFGTTPDTIITEQASEQSLGLHWFTFEELQNPAYSLHPHVKLYAESALSILGKKNHESSFCEERHLESIRILNAK